MSSATTLATQGTRMAMAMAMALWTQRGKKGRRTTPGTHSTDSIYNTFQKTKEGNPISWATTIGNTGTMYGYLITKGGKGAKEQHQGFHRRRCQQLAK
jgi:hypothetical protein